MSDDDSEFITNASQIETFSSADMPRKVHLLKGLKKGNGKVPKLYVHALSVGEYDDYLEEVGDEFKKADPMLMWWACRDAGRNHLWKSPEDAMAQIRTWPLPVKNDLKAAVNAINNNQSPKDAEGNSGGDRSESPSSPSATTSESGTSTGSSTESP